MPRAPRRARGCQAEDIRAAIERFLAGARQPALLEPGEELLPLDGQNFTLHARETRVSVQAWDRTRNLVRRALAVREETTGRLELLVERFPRREGRLFLVDLARPASSDFVRRGARMVFRERLRLMLCREFPGWEIAELTTEPDLEHSLSGVYTRGLLRKGRSGWAAIGASADNPDASGILSFGLIWLDHLRRRLDGRLVVEGLLLYLPAGAERTTCLRLPYLHADTARAELFVYSPDGYCTRVDPRDAGNLDTRLETCGAASGSMPAGIDSLLDLSGVESVTKNDGSVSLRVRGLEFAQAGDRGLRFGLRQRVPAAPTQIAEVERLALDLAARRSTTADRKHPLYRQNPEAWLESQVRAQLEQVDATLMPTPLYGQVPAFAGGERGVLDLLAVDRTGRLAVLELKASADLHLPLQALDYWMRVKWHLDRGEFAPHGYFPGITLRSTAPRLLLVSPALEFHPTTETILTFLAPSVDVERIGVGVEWRKKLEIMFRLHGAQKP